MTFEEWAYHNWPGYFGEHGLSKRKAGEQIKKCWEAAFEFGRLAGKEDAAKLIEDERGSGNTSAELAKLVRDSH